MDHRAVVKREVGNLVAEVKVRSRPGIGGQPVDRIFERIAYGVAEGSTRATGTLTIELDADDYALFCTYSKTDIGAARQSGLMFRGEIPVTEGVAFSGVAVTGVDGRRKFFPLKSDQEWILTWS